jgi:hypothetical protein
MPTYVSVFEVVDVWVWVCSENFLRSSPHIIETAIRTTKTWDGLNCGMEVAYNKSRKDCGIAIAEVWPSMWENCDCGLRKQCCVPMHPGDITDNGPVFGMDQRF